ncbi:2-amino-4-hydroxy-6-hydroxymethyldihydropteridine diphosphokinase [Luteimonas pelagia]
MAARADDRHVAWLSLGSNIEPARHLRAAADALREHFPGARFSPVYRTLAVGFEGPAFLNAAAVIETGLDPFELDAWLHALEDASGRDRSGPRYGDRPLDIDIVFFDDLVLDGPGHLQLPRPELHHAFVLKPLCDLAPGLVVPGDGRSLEALWSAHPEHGDPPATEDLVL